MEKYKWITSIEENEGEPLTISQEKYYYSAPWYCIRDEKEKQGIENGDDVRAASYVLNQLGIPAVRVFATESV
ncbi:MAG TPA: hypothetical protein VMH87_12960, partial [Pseudomonadales bacterium]|nr:hypothetical protein [Pseudomonadales bacterium]